MFANIDRIGQKHLLTAATTAMFQACATAAPEHRQGLSAGVVNCCWVPTVPPIGAIAPYS